MATDLGGAVALVTGACGNIGQEICKSLAGRGATVVGADISRDRPNEMLELDVTSEASWAAAVEAIRRDHGRLDIVVHNAGIAPMAMLKDTSLDEWRRCQAINVEGVFIGMKATLDLLAESSPLRRGGSSVIVIASGAAHRGYAMSGAYCTSKAAVTMLMRVAAQEFAAQGIRVNSVHPGTVKSAMIDGILDRYSAITGGTPKEQLEKAMIDAIPMKRLVEPDDVADVVAFLASEDARFVHGALLNVDGGHTA